MTTAGLTRRKFLQRTSVAGAGMVLAFELPESLHARIDTAPAAAFAPNAYLSISPTAIKLWVTRSEMGQGIRTTLPMILADELEVDLNAVELVQAPTVPLFQSIRLRTSGSGSSAGTWTALRQAGATAREMLVAAAAQSWSVDTKTCKAENGTVFHAASGKRATYGELATAAAKLPVPTTATTKPNESFRYIGKRVRRVDGKHIVTGSAIYGMDVRVPGMLFASVLRAPVLGGRVKSFDDKQARAMPGVRGVVPVTTGLAQGVAAIADSTWNAMRARDALKVEWEPGAQAQFSSDAYYQKLQAALAQDGYKSRYVGDAVQSMQSAARKLEATYVYPYQAHAPLETMNCTAHVRDGECEIWVPTQAPHSAQEDAMKLLQLPAEKVKVNVPLLGGGFGRRLFTDYVPEAVELSRALKAPVQIVWTRSDDMKFGYFQPASVNRIQAGLDDAGKVASWIHKVAGADLSVYASSIDANNPNRYADDGSPWGAFDNFYNLPHLKVDFVPVDSPVPTGPWRAVEYPATVFARECFVDELAHLLGKDPLAYRIELLAPYDEVPIGERKIQRARMRTVLEQAAARSEWKTALANKDGRRWGRGVACNVYHGGTHMAQVAEVAVGREGDVRVHRIVCIVDCRTALNPLGVEGQVESAITWGLSSLLGEITFKNGQAQESSYSDFRVVRYDEAPIVETHIVESGGPPAGLGEQPVPPVVPAVLNAVFAATGKRIRRIPLPARM